MCAAIVLCAAAHATVPGDVLPDPALPTRDVAYVRDGADTHRLDLYLPSDRVAAPLVVFAFGGAFMRGDRREYARVGSVLAKRGMAVAIPSYRLYPESDALGATQDVANATAWFLANAPRYGLSGERVFLVGHSAGAQIVSLLGTHPDFLRAAGVSPMRIGGIVSLAGAYDLRDLSDEPEAWQQIDAHIFGDSAGRRALVSPGLAIDPASPPFEAVCGTNDDPGSCRRTIWFVHELETMHVEAKTIREVGADHMGLLRDFLTLNDPLYAEFGTFIHEHRGASR